MTIQPISSATGLTLYLFIIHDHFPRRKVASVSSVSTRLALYVCQLGEGDQFQRLQVPCPFCSHWCLSRVHRRFGAKLRMRSTIHWFLSVLPWSIVQSLLKPILDQSQLQLPFIYWSRNIFHKIFTFRFWVRLITHLQHEIKKFYGISHECGTYYNSYHIQLIAKTVN